MEDARAGRSRDEKEVVHVADVVRHGEKIIVPETLGYKDASDILLRKLAEEEQVVAFHEMVKCYPYEGAIALHAVLNEMFGAALQEATMSFFGPRAPQQITIETGPNSKITVPWGRFAFPLDKGTQIHCGAHSHDGRTMFCISGETKKKYLPIISNMVEKVKQHILHHSIYRGKALRISFTEGGDVAEPKFIDLSKANINEMVYTRELESLIETNILTLLKHTASVKEAGIPLKRGVLLAGPYGTGKSLLARGVAKVGTDNGWTFIYIKDASELPEALEFAQIYQPAVIFAEDVDRHMSGGRTEEMDNILNTLDGIDSKTSEIMVVLTTNHLDQINQAMLRPGRLDVILNITTPDAEAVQRLIQVYGAGAVDPTTDLTKAGQLLDGFTPAVIREVVERAKLVSISRTGSAASDLIGADIETSALTMVQQQNLLKKPEPPKADWADQMATAFAARVQTEMKGNGLAIMEEQVANIHRGMGL